MSSHIQKPATDGGGTDQELLVFGYACKLFRDDEKAYMIETGHHLIPWMGDDSLKIDRYDGRGALYDLTAHEPNPTKWEQLTFEELEMERMCDKERYRSLNSAIEEEALYQEEEMKRFYQQTSTYAQVSYVYDEKPTSVTEGEIVPEEDTTPSVPFALPSELSIPPEMVVPDTMKLHAIIERTALFISQQGPQMEIIMKLKQNGNKQFDFLSHNDPLHAYYKHILSCIKGGTYIPNTEENKAWIEDEQQGEEGEYEHYLHPLLAAKPLKPKVPPSKNEEIPKEPMLQKNNDPESKISTDMTKKMIEVMVKYAAKNGPSFELIIGRRNESRFSFLKEGDPLNYLYKELLEKAPKSDKWVQKNQVKPEPKTIVKEVSENDEDSNSSEISGKGLKRKPNPVCFSIKKPKESEGLEVSSALPVEDSSDENGGDSGNSPKQAEQLKESSLDSTDDTETVSDKKKRKSKSRRHSSSHKEKDVYIQKERKMKVAQFLKGLKGSRH